MNVSMNVSITVNYSTFQTSCVCGLDAQKLLAAWWCFCGQAAVTHRYGQKYSTTVSTSTCCAMHGHAQKLMKLVNVEHLPFFFIFFLNDIFLSYSSHFMWPFPDAPRSMWLAVTLGNPTRGRCNKHELLRKFEKIWETDGCPDWNRQQESKRRIKKNSAYAKIMIISDHLRSYHDHISAKMCQNLSHRRHLVVVWRISPISPLGGLLLVLICFDDGRVDLDGAPNPLKAAIRRAWGANQPIIPPISANFVNSTLLNSESVEKTYVKQL